MLKISIQDNDGSKIYYADSVEFLNYVEDRAYTRLVLHTPKAKVKCNMFMLEPGDNVFVEEVEK